MCQVLGQVQGTEPGQAEPLASWNLGWAGGGGSFEKLIVSALVFLLKKNDGTLQKHMTPDLIWHQENFSRESVFWKITGKKIDSSLGMRWDGQGVREGIEVKKRVEFEYPQEVECV